MKTFAVKHKKLLIILAIILVLYVLIPMLARGAPPFHLFHLDADKVDSIEVVHNGDSVEFQDREEIEALVDRLNHVCYRFWVVLVPGGGSDYILHIEKGGRDYTYTVSDCSMRDNATYFADLSFVSTDLFPQPGEG